MPESSSEHVSCRQAVFLPTLRFSPSFLSNAGLYIPQKIAVAGMGILSIFVLLYLLSGIFWWTLFSSGFLVCVHAFLRDASLHKDMEDVVAMEGDLNLSEDAAFLNNSV